MAADSGVLTCLGCRGEGCESCAGSGVEPCVRCAERYGRFRLAGEYVDEASGRPGLGRAGSDLPVCEECGDAIRRAWAEGPSAADARDARYGV